MTTTIRQIKPSELTDEHRIAKILDGRFSKSESYVWDEGFGQLYAYVESLGIRGYVRAQSWEEAYVCAQDEIMDDGDETDACEGLSPEEIENGDMNEGFGYRSSGVPSNPKRHSHLYSEDLNGSGLVEVTDDYAAAHGIELYIEDEDHES